MSRTVERIERILTERFDPSHLELIDDSARHAGHAGARSGGGHFIVTLVSRSFEGLGRIEQHRSVHEALGAMIGGEIHALGLKTLTPEEWRGQQEVDS